MDYNGKIILTIFIVLFCWNKILWGFKQTASSWSLLPTNDSTTKSFSMVTTTLTSRILKEQTTLIPPGRCSVSLTVNPSPAILKSLITFYANVNCSIIPPVEYTCCYYFWRDNLSENVTITAGLTASYLQRIYDFRWKDEKKYLMEVTVCWQKSSVNGPQSDLKYSECDYAIAMNGTVFELTDTLNGILKSKQDRDFPGNPSSLIIGKEASAVFIPTDQRLEILFYKWILNGTQTLETNNSSVEFIPTNIGNFSIELHVFDKVSHKIGTFKHFLSFKEPILEVFIKGEKRLLVENNVTFLLTYLGSGPFTFCWEVLHSTCPQGIQCLYDLPTLEDRGIWGTKAFYVDTGSKSGRQKISGNLTNDVSLKIVTFEFEVYAEVNIRSGILVIILIVGVFMSSLLTYMFCHRQPKRRRLPVEVADFDFYPGLTPSKSVSLKCRLDHYYRFRILPFLARIWKTLKPTSSKQEMYTVLNGSNHEDKEILVPSNSSTSKDLRTKNEFPDFKPTLEYRNV